MNRARFPRGSTRRSKPALVVRRPLVLLGGELSIRAHSSTFITPRAPREPTIAPMSSSQSASSCSTDRWPRWSAIRRGRAPPVPQPDRNADDSRRRKRSIEGRASTKEVIRWRTSMDSSFRFPRSKLPAYRRMSRNAAKVWRDHGALEYRECVAEDLRCEGDHLPATSSARRARPWCSRGSVQVARPPRSRQRQGDERPPGDMTGADNMKDMPFDHKRMVYGGFKVVVDV